MARVKVHAVCRLPLSECICPDDDDLEPDDPQDDSEDEVA